MAFVAAEMRILNEIGSLLSSSATTSASGLGALIADVVQVARNILGAIASPTPQSGSGGSPAVPPHPTSGSPSLNLDRGSSTPDAVFKPHGS